MAQLRLALAGFNEVANNRKSSSRMLARRKAKKLEVILEQILETQVGSLDGSVLITDVKICQTVVEHLLTKDKIAVDFEGVALCRTGRLSIIQVAARSHTIKGGLGDHRDLVFLFDITKMGASAFDKGRMRDLLQSSSVLKVIFDGRADNDALHHLFCAGMKNTFDLQIQFAFTHSSQSDQYLKGLEHCLLYKGQYLCPTDETQLREVKQRGKKLFAPDLGGSFGEWEKRPLHQHLLEYAATDVKHMLNLKLFLGGSSLAIQDVTQRRIDKAAYGPPLAKGKQMAKRDFKIPLRSSSSGDEWKSEGIQWTEKVDPHPVQLQSRQVHGVLRSMR